MTYTVVLEREEDGRYTVSVPALEGCISWGDTVEHALAMARDAIAVFVEHLEAHGLPVPTDDPRVTVDVSEATQVVVTRVTVGEAAAVA